MIDVGVTPVLAYVTGESKKDAQIDRQRAIIAAAAKRTGYQILAEFWDAILTVGDSLDRRPGFAAALKRIEANGVHTILVASFDDFATDPIVQTVAMASLRAYGIDLIAADTSAATGEPGPIVGLVDQVLKAAANCERALKAARLRGVGERLRTKAGPKWRKTYAEFVPEVVQLVKRLHHASRTNGVRLTLREISAELAAAGHLTRTGKPYHPETIRRMLKGPRPRPPKIDRQP